MATPPVWQVRLFVLPHLFSARALLLLDGDDDDIRTALETDTLPAGPVTRAKDASHGASHCSSPTEISLLTGPSLPVSRDVSPDVTARRPPTEFAAPSKMEAAIQDGSTLTKVRLTDVELLNAPEPAMRRAADSSV